MGRGEAWKHFGAPTEQVGSVNEPRTHQECGVEWNEKWVYFGEDGRTVARIVLWLRYDLVGAFALSSDGSAEPLPLPE